MMKKYFMICASMSLCVLLVGSAFAPYTFDSEFAGEMENPQYMVRAKDGKIWVCEQGWGGTGKHGTVHIFNSADGTEYGFSPIAFGANARPRGIAVDTNNVVYVGVGGMVLHKVSKFDADGNSVGEFPFDDPGEVDIDQYNNLFVGHMGTQEISILDKDTGAELSGSPLVGPTGTGWHLNRAMAVWPDGSKIYMGDQTDNDTKLWEGSVTDGTVSYTGPTSIWSAQGGLNVVEVDNQGRILAGNGSNLYFYDWSDHSLLETVDLSGSFIDLRGIAFNSDSTILYLTDFGGDTNKVQKYVGTPPSVAPTPSPTPTPSVLGVTIPWALYE